MTELELLEQIARSMDATRDIINAAAGFALCVWILEFVGYRRAWDY